MSINEDPGNFEIDEPDESEDVSSSDYVYGGEIEIWEPFKAELRDSDIQRFGNQAPSRKSHARKIKIRWQTGTDEIVMRCVITFWLMILFSLCLCMGVIFFFTSRNSGILQALLSGTGVFAVLLGIVCAYFFRRYKK